MFDADFLSRVVSPTYFGFAYSMGRTLTELFPDRAVIEVPSFDGAGFAGAGACRLSAGETMFSEIRTLWTALDEPLCGRIATGHCLVEWDGHSLEMLIVGEDPCRRTGTIWIVAATTSVAEGFYRAVCDWSADVVDELLVFDGGEWSKSAALFAAIKSATFDNLILPGALCSEIQADVQQFFASRAVYERYRIPWKRGILFLGPPGNGKTHAVKALLNNIDVPCIYVKSFGHCYNDDTGIRKTFERARRIAPCAIVLEDLDALVSDDKRSSLLNELDGFENNTGILVLATTNHPERLDTALLNRPSRFDRKYLFDMPEPTERLRYLAHWNARVDDELRVDDATIDHLAEATVGFSYAFLKELCLTSMVRWVSAPNNGMTSVLREQVAILREQIDLEAEVHKRAAENRWQDEQD